MLHRYWSTGEAGKLENHGLAYLILRRNFNQKFIKWDDMAPKINDDDILLVQQWHPVAREDTMVLVFPWIPCMSPRLHRPR